MCPKNEVIILAFHVVPVTRYVVSEQKKSRELLRPVVIMSPLVWLLHPEGVLATLRAYFCECPQDVTPPSVHFVTMHSTRWTAKSCEFASALRLNGSVVDLQFSYGTRSPGVSLAGHNGITLPTSHHADKPLDCISNRTSRFVLLVYKQSIKRGLLPLPLKFPH